MKKLLMNITIAIILIIATYRVAMNNLTITQSGNRIFISVFGMTDEYIVDEPDIYYINRDGIELYSPIPDNATVEQVYRLKSDMTALKEWLVDEGINSTYKDSFIIIDVKDVDTMQLVRETLRYKCIIKITHNIATVTTVGLTPFLSESWSLEGVQPLN